VGQVTTLAFKNVPSFNPEDSPSKDAKRWSCSIKFQV
jgi:hypothetical protein